MLETYGKWNLTGHYFFTWKNFLPLL